MRKSLKAGPFRFNFSQSGIGVSAGVKGFRVGSGPRGNYIRIGGGKAHYLRTSPPQKHSVKHEHGKAPHSESYSKASHSSTHAPLEEIESGTVFAMTDSNSASLLNELNNKQKKIRSWPIILVIGIISIIAVPIKAPIALAAAGLTLIGYYWDASRKTAILCYDLDTDAEAQFKALQHSVNELSRCKGVWHIQAQGKVYDKKYHAGADSLVDRKPTTIANNPPPFVKTNIAVPMIKVGRQAIYFFPDRVFIYENDAVGAVSYIDLDLSIYSTAFIEDGRVPRDAKIIDYTWRYVNKSGGPDRRFANNPQIPIAEYANIDFQSSTGLNERIVVSRPEKAVHFGKAIRDQFRLVS